MKTTKTKFIICLLLISMIIGVLPLAKANNLDTFGYTYKDNNTLGGPTYNWIEINETGTKVLPVEGSIYWTNIYADNINIGFPFSFYGTDYSQLSIGSAGILYFEGYPQECWSSHIIGNTPEVHGFAAAYWDSLYTWTTADGSTCGIYCKAEGEAPNRRFIVEWQNMTFWGNWTNVRGGGISFEAILYEGSNNLLFQYEDVNFDVDPTWWWLDPNNGATATVGIEDPTGDIGLEYSYSQPVISDGLSILFECPSPVISSNLYASANTPPTMYAGELMTYIISYCNLGETQTSTTVLNATLSPSVTFVSASNNGVYDSLSRNVTWNIGSVAQYPLGYGTENVTVKISEATPGGTEIYSSVYIRGSELETIYDDNTDFVPTTVIDLNLPENVGIASETIIGDVAGTPIVQSTQPLTFTYDDPSATSVDISIHLSDGGSDIIGVMNGPNPLWTYTLTFTSRGGDATATFTAHHPSNDVVVAAHLEVIRYDPAGYIYDVDTCERISGATVWLQMPNGRGGWTNVPTGEDPAIMDPDVNPQITGTNGRYQWDTMAGIFRIHVEAPGYYSTDSIAVTVPPPVTDLHVGLVKIPLPQDNIPPIVGPIICSVAPVKVNTPITLSASFSDVNIHDMHSAIWTWNDGYTSKGTITESVGRGTITGGRIYPHAGVYSETITLTVTDNNGGSTQSTIQQYIVIYDPNAGFVTGGGWIDSPKGAYVTNPTVSGKAFFGFVSKYERGANVPSGSTEFDFRLANLNFHSTSYDWLIVGGVKAQYKGSGTINGAGDYAFILTATDGQLNGHGGLDCFRIKIWDETTDNVIYDNQLGAIDNADPSMIIAGGNIIIHTK